MKGSKNLWPKWKVVMNDKTKIVHIISFNKGYKNVTAVNMMITMSCSQTMTVQNSGSHKNTNSPLNSLPDVESISNKRKTVLYNLTLMHVDLNWMLLFVGQRVFNWKKEKPKRRKCLGKKIPNKKEDFQNITKRIKAAWTRMKHSILRVGEKEKSEV